MNVEFFCVFCLIFEIIEAKISDEEDCGFSENFLKQLTIWREIRKSGFHRELVTGVHCVTDLPGDLQVLLVQRFPSGIYIDPYQLASQQPDVGLQVLLDSKVDLEAPAYSSAGFTAFLFLDRRGVRCLPATVPIHARYQRPSNSGSLWERVDIEVPCMLLRTDSCELFLPSPPAKLVEAPCTARNLSMCTWLETPLQQNLRVLSLHVPIGDQSLVVPVCVGTLLVTLLCFGLVAAVVWKHGFRHL